MGGKFDAMVSQINGSNKSDLASGVQTKTETAAVRAPETAPAINQTLLAAALGSPQTDSPNLTKAPKQQLAEARRTEAKKLVELGLPETSIGKVDPVKDVLQTSRASASEKLKMVELLARQGQTQVKLADADGVERNCRVEMEKVGKPGKERVLIHLFAQGSDGREHVVLRGISDGAGNYEQQRDKNGKVVSYIGTWWSKKMEKSVIGGQEG